MLTIGLDVDDVLLDHISAWVTLYNEASGDHLSPAQVTSWDIRRFVTPTFYDRVYTLRTPELYERVEPVFGAVEGVLALQSAGHRLVAVTNEPRGPNVAAKRAALARFFPGITEVVVAKEKNNAVRYDLLVDDNPRAQPTHLFDRPHNQNVLAFATENELSDLTRGVPLPLMYVARVYDWRDVTARLARLTFWQRGT